MEPLFRDGTYYSRVIVKAMLSGDAAKVREAMVANEINVLFDAIENGEDVELLQLIAANARKAYDCDTIELLEMARSQCHWENLNL